MSKDELVLKGLDGANPLAFLAAIGLLRVLTEQSLGAGRPRPALSWWDDGVWRPQLHGWGSLEDVLDAVMIDLDSWRTDPVLQLAYTRSGERADAADANAISDIKPPPQVMHEFLEEMAARAALDTRRSADFAACLVSETAFDNSGKIKPTAFHFTAGQQQFLRMIAALAGGLQMEHVKRALVGPWARDCRLPTMSWDSMTARIYALRASDPSGDKRGGEPGADWLAFQGLSAFPVASKEGRLQTPCFQGRWKNATFTWPVWSAPASFPSIRSLLTSSGLADMSPLERRSRGIEILFTSAVTRSDQGGYGNFAPSSPSA